MGYEFKILFRKCVFFITPLLGNHIFMHVFFRKLATQPDLTLPRVGAGCYSYYYVCMQSNENTFLPSLNPILDKDRLTGIV